MMSVDHEKYSSPEALCINRITHFKAKANHNKNEALACLILIIGLSLSTPILINFGETAFVAKLLPSVCSVVATALTTWLQVRKPQQLWALYRTAERELEDALYKYKFNVSPFDSVSKQQVLASRCAEIALGVHRSWLPLIPVPESTGVMKENKPTVSE